MALDARQASTRVDPLARGGPFGSARREALFIEEGVTELLRNSGEESMFTSVMPRLKRTST